MKIYDGEKLIKAHRCPIYGGELTESPRMKIHGGDKLIKVHRCPIYGGEITESLRMKIHGGDKTKIKGDALNKLEIPPNQDESGGMPQTR